MAQDADVFSINQCMGAENGNTLCRVTQHFAHERVAAQQAVTHLIVMLLNISYFIGLCACPIAAPVFKTNRVGCQDNEPLSG